MTPAAIIAAIESLSSFEHARLLGSPTFWAALGIAEIDGAAISRLRDDYARRQREREEQREKLAQWEALTPQQRAPLAAFVAELAAGLPEGFQLEQEQLSNSYLWALKEHGADYGPAWLEARRAELASPKLAPMRRRPR